jgi:hypothetical protein
LEIVKKLGTPTEIEVAAMNPDYQQKPLPKVIGSGFEHHLAAVTGYPDPNAVDLI